MVRDDAGDGARGGWGDGIHVDVDNAVGIGNALRPGFSSVGLPSGVTDALCGRDGIPRWDDRKNDV